MAAATSAGDHRVVAPDARGHGESGWDGGRVHRRGPRRRRGRDHRDARRRARRTSSACPWAAARRSCWPPRRPDLVDRLVLADTTAATAPTGWRQWAERARTAAERAAREAAGLPAGPLVRRGVPSSAARRGRARQRRSSWPRTPARTRPRAGRFGGPGRDRAAAADRGPHARAGRRRGLRHAAGDGPRRSPTAIPGAHAARPARHPPPEPDRTARTCGRSSRSA